ncbi:hypothetical protein K2173_000313 [Erythroxylum novogranatense]|uniref:Nitrate regulatory gene2 protein-like n=1 Tax=Erythroxylum novogranatense TaxID=1862640 RepID=A0AAV8SVY2_9ROSI|nr:hypothetical protein K2173_000313 [Erythroxylum novogranatense]
MGCAASRIEKEERVQMCKDRKRLMKQLVEFRGEFADSQLAYLKAMKNTGATLRQFTESESLDLGSTSYDVPGPPSPPFPLPPSPPPPPPFSPDLKRSNHSYKEMQEESTKVEEVDYSFISSSWNTWNPFEPYSQLSLERSEIVDPVVEEEHWAETKSHFEEDDQEDGVGNGVAFSNTRERQKQQPVELIDDNSSTISCCTKETADKAVVKRRRGKTMDGIVKEIDDYFLKASAGRNEIVVLMDVPKGDTFLLHNFKDNKRKRSNSAKVFSALSWSWSSKSLHYGKDASEVCNSSEPCRPGAHCITLDKLYAAEQKLYKEVKEEEITKLELEKKTTLLLKQEEENHDWSKIEKTRLSVEGLETDIRKLQHSISTTCSTILELIDVELYPQLLTLISGLKNMWRTMYECHQIQNHIAQELNHLSDDQICDFSTDYHRQATAQLEAEVNSWYLSFCQLTKSQREYVVTLNAWIELTACLVDDQHQSLFSSLVRGLCKEWKLALHRLPDKIASETIKGLLSAIQSIMLQQAEEHTLHKRFDKLERRLQKELLSLDEMEKKLDWSFDAGDTQPELSPKNPLLLKRAKTEALKLRTDAEKTKYMNSVQVTKAKTLSKLKTSLPNVFQALIGFSNGSAQALEAVCRHGSASVECDASENSMN